MKRSGILCSLGALAVTSLLPQKAAASDTLHWTYEGEEGPAHWGDLTPDFKTCSLGMQQSPIDLNRAVPAHIGALDIKYRPTPLRVINNGHTVQVNYAPGSILTIHGHTYEVAQFHFHTPSEHKVAGKSFPLEMHIVHKDSKNELMVLGVFFEESTASNAALEVVWNAAPATAGPERTVPGSTVNVEKLIPVAATNAYYEYLGSLTVPPCSENVMWVVLTQPNTISSAQIETFRHIFPENARPLQPFNQRLVVESGV